MSTLFQLVAAGTNALGTDPVRFFEFGTAPELEQLPYATWQELSGSPFNVLDGVPSADSIKYQIDVWAETAAECRAITREIRMAIVPSHTVTFYQNTWDEPSRLYRSILHCTTAKEI